MVIILPERRAEQLHFQPCKFLDTLVAALQFLRNLLGGNLAHMRMGRGMVPEVMPIGGNFFDLLGIFFDPITAEKKRRLDVIFTENAQKLIGIISSPSRVKTDGNLRFFGINTINRKLPLD